jgi:hypothetical protein
MNTVRMTVLVAVVAATWIWLLAAWFIPRCLPGGGGGESAVAGNTTCGLGLGGRGRALTEKKKAPAAGQRRKRGHDRRSIACCSEQ